MRKRRTPVDLAFAAEFGRQLEAAFQKNVKNKRNPNRLTADAFAKSLNLTRAGLHKAKKGKSIPKLDLIEKARRYDVSVKYGDLSEELQKRRTKKHPKDDLQLFLPLSLENLKKDNVRVELGEHKGDAVELRVWIKFTG
jgi:transcriptional regulator with XRE-family HTH domain